MAKVWPAIIGLAGVVFAAGMILAVNASENAKENRIPSEEELPDGILFSNTENLPEVKAFLAKYPDAEATIDRSGRLAVDYSKSYKEVTLSRAGEEYHPSLRLRIFMSQEGEPTSMFAACRDINDGWKMVGEEEDVTGYLQTERCFG